MLYKTESTHRKPKKQKVHRGNRKKTESKQRGRGTKLKVKQREKTAVEDRG